MAQMSDYLKNKLINGVYRNIPYSPPTNLYVALYSDDPTSGDIGTELAGSGYARVTASFDEPAAGSGTTQNTSDIIFPQATADWVTITHVAIRDLETGGNMLSFQALQTPTDVLATNNFRIPAGALTLVMS